ncbi:aspartate beta-hydroxylase domain-containing protein 2-like [Palaemon carinicauda]|uniref:aspartate beta-hydroxylase domain-containing protein 2-like n=1 Tax=Palaemon carinicauda TaxID=392227 RepID=UPI0035B5E72C
MGFKECCSTFVAGLPDPAVPFLPSLLLGTFFAALFLVIVYKRQTNKPYREIAFDVGKMLVYALPSHEETDTKGLSACKNPSCVRCQNYKELSIQLISRYADMKIRNVRLTSRVEEAIKSVKENVSHNKHMDSDHKQVESTRKLKKRRSSYQNPTIFYMDLAANAFWNDFNVYVPEVELLKLNFKIILEEFQDVFESLQSGSSHGWKLNDIANGHWCIYPFIDQGVAVERNCRKCPNTATMLGSLPSVMRDCVFGNACFSILYPDSHIEPHHGPTNLRLRCHLGLKIPDGCFLEVGGEQRKWEVKETIIFDDSFEHSATFKNNHSSLQSLPRAILMVDFWHPDISGDEKKVLMELLAP